MEARRVWAEIAWVGGTTTVVVTIATVAAAQLGVKLPRALFFAAPAIAASGAVAYAWRKGEQILPEIQPQSSIQAVHADVRAIRQELDSWKPVPLDQPNEFIPTNPDPQWVQNCPNPAEQQLPVDAAEPFSTFDPELVEDAWGDSELDALLSPPGSRNGTY